MATTDLYKTKEKLYARTRIELSTGRILYLANETNDVLMKIDLLENVRGSVQVVEVYTDNVHVPRKRRITLFMPVVSVSPVACETNIG